MERDETIKNIFSGEDHRLALIIGPCSSDNEDAVVDYVKNNAIDGVFVGFNDMLLPYYAEICEKSGLPCYGTKEQSPCNHGRWRG